MPELIGLYRQMKDNGTYTRKAFLKAAAQQNADQASAEFLSKLNLSVRVHREDGMEELFELSEEAMARPTDWFCLGTVCPDGEVDLDIILTGPTELGNSFQNQIHQ